MFLGDFRPKLDDKGRLLLPAKYRSALDDGLVITRGQKNCLFVFPTAEFTDMYQRLLTTQRGGKQHQDFIRLFLAGANDQELDKQGRLSIPARLRRYAGLDRDVVVIGQGSRLEVWDAEKWDNYVQEMDAGFAAIAEEVIPEFL